MNVRYVYAVLLGLLYYPLQQLVFFFRFGRWNTTFLPIDLLLPITGMLAFAFHFYVLRKTPSAPGRMLLWVLFIVLGIPSSLLGMLGGGLFGPAGVVIAGLLPVLIVVLLGRGLVKLIWKV